jgi:lysyl-tRNA synthetase class 1
LANPVWHIHQGQPPASDMVVSFAMLLNLASAANAHDKGVLWGFIRRYAPEASPASHPGLDAAAGWAVRYFEDFVRPAKRYRGPEPKEAAALADLRDRLRAWDGPAEAEALQNLVFAVGNAHGFEPLRAWFAAIYEVLLGEAQGPRFGGFIAIYGVPETVALIDAALAGKLVSDPLTSGA